MSRLGQSRHCDSGIVRQWLIDPRPPAATSAEPARWLTDRTGVDGQKWVTNPVCSGFAAYARLFHPLDDHPGSPTWAAAAQANGRTKQASVQWEKITPRTNIA